MILALAFALSLQSASWSHASETHERIVHVGSKTFTVRYLVEHTGYATVPAVGCVGDGCTPQQSHYDAKIQVFEKRKRMWTHGASCGEFAACPSILITEEIEVDVPIGRELSGKWTANGCKVDDDPIEHVRRARIAELAAILP